jgi:hypothetical protein
MSQDISAREHNCCHDRHPVHHPYRAALSQGTASVGSSRAVPTGGSGQALANGSANLLRRFHLISLAITVIATGNVLFVMGLMAEQYLLGKAVTEAGDRAHDLRLSAVFATALFTSC